MATLGNSGTNTDSELSFTGERIVPEADNCEPRFAQKMYQEHIARYLFASQACRGKQVLDVACGVGYGSQILAKAGAAGVTGFDLSADAIAHARKFYQHDVLEYRVASGETFDFKRTFDVVTCFEMIEHVDNQEGVLDRVAAHMSDDGLLFISTPRAIDKPRSAFHTREFTQNEFRLFLQRRFPHVAFYVENNHFASLVTDCAPERLQRISILEPKRLTLGAADYFVAVASKSPLPKLDAQLTLNTDDYVTMLERDVEILRKGESDAHAELADRQRDVVNLNAELDRERAAAASMRLAAEQAKSVSGRLQHELAAAAAREAAIAGELASMRQRFHELDDLHARTSRDLQYATSSFSWKATQPLRMAKDMMTPAVKAPLGRMRRGAKAKLKQAKTWYSGRTAEAESVAPKAIQTDVLFIIGCHDGESKRYRVHNLVEAMELAGGRAVALGDNEIPQLLAQGFSAKAVVLFRVAYDDTIERLLERARSHKVPVFFDVDDLVFEPENIDNVRAIKSFSATDRAQYLDGVRRYRQTLLACDYAICPTEFLKQRVEASGKPAFVIANTVNSKQIAQSDRVRRQHPTTNDTVRIAYFSGSNTHQVDFAQCETALRKILEKYPNTRLLVVGYLELSNAWKPLANRVERAGFQPYLQMLETLAGVDINLAPLEVGNPYCESKSELKVFEAGLVNVPTVASPTAPYSNAISNGRDGMLAATEKEWFAALETLVKDPDKRRAMGQNARVRALQQFGVAAIAQNAKQIYLEPRARLESARPRTNTKKLKVAWIVPGLPKGSGGHRNILRVAYHLSKFGHDLALYVVDTQDSSEQLTRTAIEHFYPLECPVMRYEGVIEPTDVLFATHWSTVRVALAHRDLAKRLAYFVQDFEPLFHPMGTDYIMAENTYRQGLYHITSGPWCAHVLRTQFNVQAESFQFPIDRSIYFPRERKTPQQRVLFFGRPEMPRRCFDLGLAMLEQLHRMAPEIEIVMYGSHELNNRSYPFRATIQGHVPGIDGLAHLYSDVDVGIAFSTTNPSLVPYEMMACGLPVVDLARPGSEINYGGRSDIALLADAMPETMARQVVELIRNPAELKQRRRAGLEFSATLPDEEQMSRRVEELLLGLVG